MSTERIIMGRNSVTEALRAHRAIIKIYVAEGNVTQPVQRIRDLAAADDILVENVSIKELNQMAPGNRHQGVIALAPPVAYAELENVLDEAAQKGRTPFLVLPDGIEDVHNLGAIIRTAECAGVDAVLLPKRRSAPINETVSKTSAGAVEYMPLVQIGNIAQTLKQLKKRGFWVIGADMDGTTDYFHSSLTDPIVLIIGSEGKGISRLVKEACDVVVSIPMAGHVNSLNASVAAALLMYEVVRQRQGE